MKSKFILSLLVLLMAVTASYASFPVQRTATANTTVSTTIDTVDEEVTLESPAATAASDDFLVAVLLWLFLGGFAAHRWFLGSPIGWNILFILTLGGLGIWWIIDGIDILTRRYPGL